MDKKEEFDKVAVRKADKREFAIIAASEGRTHVDIFADMLKIYKAISVQKNPQAIKNVSVVDVIQKTSPHSFAKRRSKFIKSIRNYTVAK